MIIHSSPSFTDVNILAESTCDSIDNIHVGAVEVVRDFNSAFWYQE